MLRKYLLYINVFFLCLSCYSDTQSVRDFIPLEGIEPIGVDAKRFYNESYYTDDEMIQYSKVKKDFFRKLEPVKVGNTQILELFSGVWEISDLSLDELYTYDDYKSCFEEIQFGYLEYSGYSFSYWGSSGSYPAYIYNDSVVSSVRTMGWIAPILRFELNDEKLFVYILDHDIWRLADFHNNGDVPFMKVAEEFNPSIP